MLRRSIILFSSSFLESHVPRLSMVSALVIACIPTLNKVRVPQPTVSTFLSSRLCLLFLQLSDIAECSADTAAAFGIDPRVALLSYSTLGSGSGSDVEIVQGAVDNIKTRRPDIKACGPLQYDAAVDPEVARTKVKVAPEMVRVAGKANVLVFPDLNTGNNTYKAVQQATQSVAMGPVLQGLAKPVNDLSRGCTQEDVVNTICVTVIQAIQAGKK